MKIKENNAWVMGQDCEMTLAEEPLVKENSFIARIPEDKELPLYTEIKHQLPNPVWEGHNDAIDCYWKAWELGFRNLKKPIQDTGFVSNFIDTAFNGNLFMWDSAFILMFGKYADRIFKFQKTLDNFYSHQHKDGYICREIHEDTGCEGMTRFDPSATGPETMAWCEWEYFLNFGDRQRLAEVFPPLMAFHRWMREHHTWPNGTYFSSGWGCGMDNLPRQQPGYVPAFSHGHMVWVDACMQALNDGRILMEMAKVLGREEFVLELQEECDALAKVINEQLWDENTGFYYDLWKDGRLNGVRHVGAYWALIAGCASSEQAKSLVSYLKDENEFGTPNRVPALSKSSDSYRADGGYWCGGVWAPTTYMVLKGLEKYGELALAHQIGKEHLYAVVEVFKKHGTVFENYAPEYIDEAKPSKGGCSKPDFVGWTGLSPISILYEFVFGIKPNADKKKIVWDVNLLEKHGVERYPFGTEGELTLLCEARTDANQKPQITLISNVPVELEVLWGEGEKKQSMIMQTNM